MHIPRGAPTLQSTKTIGPQNRDLALWRFGFRVREKKKVRDHVRQGHLSQCFSKMCFTVQCWSRPTTAARKKNETFVHVCRMSDPTDHPRDTRGTQPLAKLTGRLHNQSPSVFFPSSLLHYLLFAKASKFICLCPLGQN